MPATTRLTLLVDAEGRVLAAELPGAEARARDAKTPAATLLPQAGQRIVQKTLSREVLALSGPSLHQVFSEAGLGPDGRLKLPRIRVERMRK